ncbi:DUF6247 family protein [Nonomuraea sp. NPDC050790]|uniref:DUF6247 family protein n=1 Tax=Nonomuraea sp. NPDC050790 TaxID=3364371 RepID=UPI0037A313CD
MSAQPVEPHAIAHDPSEIRARLPERYHEQFRAEYQAAMVAAAHEDWRWKELAAVLNLWHLRSLTYSQPGYQQARAEVAEGAAGMVPAEEVILGWPSLVDEYARRTAS